MNIQPPPPSRRGISVAEPLTPALQQVKQMLFKPFDLAKWVTIGFCAWLAGLGESGGGGGFNYNLNDHRRNVNGNGQPLEELRHFLGSSGRFVLLFGLGRLAG